VGYKGLFIDDYVDQAEIYAPLLSSKGEDGLTLDCSVAKENVAEFANEIFESNPNIVALDFSLDDNLELVSPKKAYKGSGLAQLLRDKIITTSDPCRDFPIVLVSAEDKLSRLFRPDSTAHDLFDKTYVKEKATEDKEQVRKELVALCHGYSMLKSVWNGDRLNVFGLPEKEQRSIETQELTWVIADAAAPHIVARFILREVIDRAGLLLSDNEVAARLGVAKTEAEGFEKLLSDNSIRYEGIFHGGWRRWWAHRFDAWAENFFARRPTSLTGIERVRLLRERAGLDLVPAVSAWNGSSDERFAFACASCGQPTEVRHSLAAFDSRVPRFGQRRRICWDCIQTDKYLYARLSVDDIDSNLVEEVKDKIRRNERD
jgi:hypothetical protein